MSQLIVRKLDHRIFFLCCSIGLVLRLVLALFTFGTNDMTSWLGFLKTIEEFGLVEIYHRVELFNHPPLVGSYLLLLSRFMAGDYTWFPFLLRLPAVLADMGSAVMIYLMISQLWGRERGLKSGCLVALSPVFILVSGFHGNTDPVFVFITLVALYSLTFLNLPFLAGCILGLSMSIKVVPLILVPLFFVAGRTRGARVNVALGGVLFFLLGWAYHLSVAYSPVVRHVFEYGSLAGKWGISQVPWELGLWYPWMSGAMKGDKKASSSNYGVGIDLCAPGTQILATVPGNKYAPKTGTSMASPNAAAVAALIWSTFPDWSRDQVAAALLGSAENIDKHNDSYKGMLGVGRVNSHRALTAKLGPTQIHSIKLTTKEISLRVDGVLDPTLANDPNSWVLSHRGERVPLKLSAPYRVGSNRITLVPVAPIGAGAVFKPNVNILKDPFGVAPEVKK